ncbi:hypothetical protein CYMTET_26120, partial [Cymbomonas tetramitiformis]
RLGPLQLAYLPEGSGPSVVADGLHTNPSVELGPGEDCVMELQLVALMPGVQKISSVGVCEAGHDSNKRALDTMRPIEVFVEAA